jgi:hypothetical protein
LLIQHLTTKIQTRNAVRVTELWTITLRLLATGDSYYSMMYMYEVSTQSA